MKKKRKSALKHKLNINCKFTRIRTDDLLRVIEKQTISGLPPHFHYVEVLFRGIKMFIYPNAFNILVVIGIYD